MKITSNDKIFLELLKKEGIELVKEYKFLQNRKFRFDYAIPEHKIAIEIEGGVYTYGRHNRPIGYLNDMEKYNLAVLNDWKILRFPSLSKISQKDIDMIVKLYNKTKV